MDEQWESIGCKNNVWYFNFEFLYGLECSPSSRTVGVPCVYRYVCFRYDAGKYREMERQLAKPNKLWEGLWWMWHGMMMAARYVVSHLYCEGLHSVEYYGTCLWLQCYLFVRKRIDQKVNNYCSYSVKRLYLIHYCINEEYCLLLLLIFIVWLVTKNLEIMILTRLLTVRGNTIAGWTLP